jgi:hypothetical protein
VSKRRKRQHRSPAPRAETETWTLDDVLQAHAAAVELIRQTRETPALVAAGHAAGPPSLVTAHTAGSPLRAAGRDPVAAEYSAAQLHLGEIHHGLVTGDIYEAVPDMVQAMARAASLDRGSGLDKAGLPSPSGFVFLDRLWPVQFKSACPRSLSWTRTVIDGNGEGLPVIVMVVYGDQLKTTSSYLLPLGSHPGEWRAGGKEMANAGQLVRTLWRYLNSEFLTTRRTEPASAPQPHLQRSLQHGQVHVVLLRRSAPREPGEEPGHRDVSWSCRWTVKPHWRHLGRYDGPGHRAVPEPDGGGYACVVCQNRVTQVRTYIKGPEGKPLLKEAPTIYKLARLTSPACLLCATVKYSTCPAWSQP